MPFSWKKRLFLFLQQLKNELGQFAHSNNWDVRSAVKSGRIRGYSEIQFRRPRRGPALEFGGRVMLQRLQHYMRENRKNAENEMNKLNFTASKYIMYRPINDKCFQLCVLNNLSVQSPLILLDNHLPYSQKYTSSTILSLEEKRTITCFTWWGILSILDTKWWNVLIKYSASKKTISFTCRIDPCEGNPTSSSTTIKWANVWNK